MRTALKTIIVIVGALSLAACGHLGGLRPDPGTTSPADLIIPRPTPVELQRVDIVVVNKDNFDQFAAMVESGQVFVTIPIEEFRRMIENNQQITVYMANQNLVIDQYENRIRNPANN